MRKLLALCGAVLCFSVCLGAQDNPGALRVKGSSSPGSSARSYRTAEFTNWQVSVSYEYVRFRAAGRTFNLHGFNTTVTRFANEWFGLEAAVGGGFGAAINNQNPRLLVYGGGPHLAWRRHPKFEPWIHATVGGAHFLPQTALGSANALAYVGGGGFDFKLTPRLAFRVQGDYVGSRFFSRTQNNFQVVSGFAINF